MKLPQQRLPAKARDSSIRFRLSKRHRIERSLILITIIIVGLASIAGLGFVDVNRSYPDKPGRLVTFRDRGQDHVILTDAKTVRDAISDARISVDPKDVVEPAIDSELFSTDSAVIIYRARMVLVVDGALRERVLTPAQSPNEIATAARIDAIGEKDKTSLGRGNFVADGASTVLTISRAQPEPEPVEVAFAPGPRALTKSKGAQLYSDVNGVAHRETYYDLPMNVVIGACGPGGYTIRYDGAKIDKDGYVLVAANYGVYPKCSVVETSMGPGKVYDTGGFAKRYPHGFDLATDWTNYDGR